MKNYLAFLPNMKYLMDNGVSTLKGQAMDPTVSGPNWSSMLTGYQPSTTLISGNGAVTRKISTFFKPFKMQQPGGVTAAAVSWEWLYTYFVGKNENVDLEYDSPGDQDTTDKMASWIRSDKP